MAASRARRGGHRPGSQDLGCLDSIGSWWGGRVPKLVSAFSLQLVVAGAAIGTEATQQGVSASETGPSQLSGCWRAEVTLDSGSEGGISVLCQVRDRKGVGVTFSAKRSYMREGYSYLEPAVVLVLWGRSLEV